MKQCNHCQFIIRSIADVCVVKKKGKMYGDNFITHFKDDIAGIFERGERDKGAKMTAEII